MKNSIAVFDLSVTNNSPAGSCVLQIVSGLREEYQFTTFSDAFDNPAPELIDWVRVSLPKKPLFLRYILFQLLALLHYKRRVTPRGRPWLVLSTEGEFVNCDICYAHFCHAAYLKHHWPSTPVRGLRRIARWITHKFNAFMEAKAFEKAKAIVVPSRGLARELVQTYPQLDKRRIVQIPNPVDINSFARPEAFNSATIRKSLGFASEDLVIVFVALGDFARKGLVLLLEALAAIENPTAKLLVVGGNESEIREYVRVQDKLGLSGSVVFVGFQADVRPYLWSSNLFGFASAYEVFPLAVLQAAAAGLPIVAPKISGIEEFLQDGVNGWLIERKVDSIAAVLKVALENREKLLQMGDSARATASQYDVHLFVERWRFLLDSLSHVSVCS